MKKMSLIVLSLFLSQMVSALTLKDIAGKYEITHPNLPKNIVMIEESGSVSLVEIHNDGNFICNGIGAIVNDSLETSMKCEDDSQFTQKINLKNINNGNEFKAKVFSSLFGGEIEMNFKKLN